MRINRAGLPFIVASLCLCSAAQAQINPYGVDKRFYVAPMFSYTYSDSQRGTGDGLGGSVAIGKRVTKNIDLEVIGFFSNYNISNSQRSAANAQQVADGFPASGQPGSLQLYGVGAGFNVYAFDGFDEMFSTGIFKNLYVHGDIMRGQGRGEPGPVRNYTSTIYNAGLGYNLPLDFTLGGLLGPGLSLRLEALYRLDQHNRDYIGRGDHKYFQEAVVDVGLRIPLGGRPEPVPAQPEAPVQVVPTAAAAPPPPPPPPPCVAPSAGQPIDLEGCRIGDTLVLHGVNFEFNKAKLTLNAQAILNQVSDALQSRKDINIEIDGYTDSVGSNSYNLKLSQRRADSVKQYLIGHGVDAGRITTKGFGEAQPVASNDTDEGRELNRRVELKITAENNAEGAAEPDGSASPPPGGSAGEGGMPPAAAAGNTGGAAPVGGMPGAAPAGGAPGAAPAGAEPGGSPANTSNLGSPAAAPATGGAPTAGDDAGGAAPAGSAPAGGAPPI